ncbi:antichymotrypsin-2-like [Tribolium castaneum]|uniref:antichymotrypsin-2-like n=1 Tax=Tribolium castaneum TaxID=7070 RepID=UPI0030FDFAB2
MKSIVVLFIIFYVSAAQETAIQEFTNANNQFTSSVYKELSKTENGNFMVSPFSAETVLAFAQSGCKGNSAEELRNSLHLPNDKTKVESALKSLLPKIKGNDLYTLHTANKMYVKKDFAIKEEFKRAASQVYYADSESIDFTKNVEAANVMNSWVEKHTKSKITNLIDSNDLDKFTRAVLINALYFKANWSLPFELRLTSKREFYKTASDSIEVDMMQHLDEHFNYYESPDLKAQFLELPFLGGEASMVFVLPNEKDGLARLETQLESVFVPQHQLKSTFLNVVLPKFRIESEIDFKSVLMKLGVAKVFDDEQADLSGIAGEKGDLVIDKIVQKTFIDVSEEGVEAAAATYVLIGFPASAILHQQQPKNFIADHPFIFYIKVKDLVIFAGRVTNPSQ